MRALMPCNLITRNTNLGFEVHNVGEVQGQVQGHNVGEVQGHAQCKNLEEQIWVRFRENG